MRLALIAACLVLSSCAHRRIKNECKALHPEPDETAYKWCVHERIEAHRAAQPPAPAPEPPSTFWRDFNEGFQAGNAVGKSLAPPAQPSPSVVDCETHQYGDTLKTTCRDR